MPLPVVVGGAIAKVGGSVLTATAVNTILAVLTKLKLPVGKVKDVLIDKLIDYAIDQVTSSGANAAEPLKIVNIWEGYGSVLLPLGSFARGLSISITELPIGLGQRFSDTLQDGQTSILANGQPPVQTNLPNKGDYGAVSFAAVVSVLDARDNPTTINTGLNQEIPIEWRGAYINVPKIGNSAYATSALLYLPPFIKAKVDLLYVYEPPAPSSNSGGGGNNGGGNDPPKDDPIFIDFDGDGVNDFGG